MRKGFLSLAFSFAIACGYLIYYLSNSDYSYTVSSYNFIYFSISLPDLSLPSHVILVLIGIILNLFALITCMQAFSIGAAVLYGVAIGISPIIYPYITFSFLLCVFATVRTKEKQLSGYITRDEFISTLEFYRKQGNNNVPFPRDNEENNVKQNEYNKTGLKTDGEFSLPSRETQSSTEQVINSIINSNRIERQNSDSNAVKYVIVIVLLIGTLVALAVVPRFVDGFKPANELLMTMQPGEVPDLRGYWIMEPDNGTSMGAQIIDDTITMKWLTDDGTQALYWVGSYVSPKDDDLPYEWTSINDKSKTEMAILASSDDTKEFTFDGTYISFTASAMGVTRTIKLHRTETAPF